MQTNSTSPTASSGEPIASQSCGRAVEDVSEHPWTRPVFHLGRYVCFSMPTSKKILFSSMNATGWPAQFQRPAPKAKSTSRCISVLLPRNLSGRKRLASSPNRLMSASMADVFMPTAVPSGRSLPQRVSPPVGTTFAYSPGAGARMRRPSYITAWRYGRRFVWGF